MTQSDMVLAYMRDNGSITPWEALREIGCMRLGARIYDLRMAGHEIHAENVREKNRWGRTVCYARYTLGGNG